MTNRPDGWTRIVEAPANDGLIYFYADGSTYHLDKAALHNSIFPDGPTGYQAEVTGLADQTAIQAQQPTA